MAGRPLRRARRNASVILSIQEQDLQSRMEDAKLTGGLVGAILAQRQFAESLPDYRGEFYRGQQAIYFTTCGQAELFRELVETADIGNIVDSGLVIEERGSGFMISSYDGRKLKARLVPCQ